MVDIEKLKEELEEIEELEDKVKFLHKKFKEAKTKEEKKEIIKIVEELITPQEQGVLPQTEDFSTPGQVFKPTLSKEEEPLEEIIAPAKSEEDESVKYTPAHPYSAPSDVYTSDKKVYATAQYEPKHETEEVEAARRELEEERSREEMYRSSETSDISETLKKEKGRSELR